MRKFIITTHCKPLQKMDFSKQYICLLVYGLKSDELATASSRRINAVFGDDAGTERPAQTLSCSLLQPR
ncbi:hypothetical protein Y032_0552g3344 [Ancylostoma ceylanicum]|uniref:Uncharacterized protein n=1 Tax=Ancylostoma ceylanicum TaxID=53326 RepID=A0A016WRI1_9BILA|nr:hypothetical protein Y032_0552g3344 [Ancylostoma ceylanicum]